MVKKTENRIQILDKCKFWFQYRVRHFPNAYVHNFLPAQIRMKQKLMSIAIVLSFI